MQENLFQHFLHNLPPSVESKPFLLSLDAVITLIHDIGGLPLLVDTRNVNCQSALSLLIFTGHKVIRCVANVFFLIGINIPNTNETNSQQLIHTESDNITNLFSANTN
jgi:hypothetical protein